jgi:hypothetical protein
MVVSLATLAVNVALHVVAIPSYAAALFKTSTSATTDLLATMSSIRTNAM